jgi:hypothetical protein
MRMPFSPVANDSGEPPRSPASLANRTPSSGQKHGEFAKAQPHRFHLRRHGTTWSAAKIIDEPIYGVWRRWKYDWTVPLEPGRHILKSRATASAGIVQPVEHDKNYGSYVIHHGIGIEVVTK